MIKSLVDFQSEILKKFSAKQVIEEIDLNNHRYTKDQNLEKQKNSSRNIPEKNNFQSAQKIISPIHQNQSPTRNYLLQHSPTTTRSENRKSNFWNNSKTMFIGNLNVETTTADLI